MSSSPGTERTRTRRLSLRARLLVGQVLLLVTVVIGVGIVTELALQQFLVHQLDSSLLEFEKRSLADSGGGALIGPPPDGGPNSPVPPPPDSSTTTGPGPSFLNRFGTQPDTIGALIGADKSVAAGKIHADGSQTALSDKARQQLGAVAPGKTVTVNIDGQGRYRVTASTTWSGKTVVTALPLSSVEAILMRVLLILLIVTVVVLLIAITVGVWLIRRALDPLDRVAATAARVADLPLDRGEVALPVRVPAEDSDPRTEVGRLGAALNSMLDHISAALSSRHDSETRVRQFLADASHELRTPSPPSAAMPNWHNANATKSLPT